MEKDTLKASAIANTSAPHTEMAASTPMAAPTEPGASAAATAATTFALSAAPSAPAVPTSTVAVTDPQRQAALATYFAAGARVRVVNPHSSRVGHDGVVITTFPDIEKFWVRVRLADDTVREYPVDFLRPTPARRSSDGRLLA